MKKSLIIFTVLILILSFGGCGTRSGKVEEAKANVPENEAGDTAGDVGLSAVPVVSEPDTAPTSAPEVIPEVVNNRGDCALSGGRLYYINNYDNITLYSMNIDGSDNRKLNDDWTSWFYVSGDRIYYRNGQGGELYAMNTDGSGEQKLNDDDSMNVNVVGDRIYYSVWDEASALYSMNTDGSDRRKVDDGSSSYRNVVVDDRIYYYGDFNGSKGIYSVKTDGSGRIKLTEDSPYRMTVADGWIYYNNEDDDTKLYAVRADGSDRHKLTDDYGLSINVADNRIYYQNGNENKIYSINTDGSDRKLLSEDSAEWLVVGGGRIFYTMTGANIYSMNTDGSDKRILADLRSGLYKDVTYEISASLREDMPEYRFVAKGMTTGTDEWVHGSVMGLEVFDENGLSLLTADFSYTFRDLVEGNGVYNIMMDTMGLHVTDVNFDGYKDVIILNNFSGAHANTWYDCWLWNPEDASFVKAETFTDIANPALDMEKKCIYSTGGSGAGNRSWTIYQFIDGKFKATNNLSYNEGNEGYHFQEQKLVNGEMEMVRDDVIKEDSFEDAVSAAGYIGDELWQLEHPRWYGVGGHEADQWLE